MVFYFKAMVFIKTAVFADYDLKVVKLTNSFHSSVRTQGGNINFFLKTAVYKSQFINHGFKSAVLKLRILPKNADFGQTKDHFPRKGNPYIS